MKFDIRAQQIFGYVDKWAGASKVPIRLMVINRRVQATQTRILGAVSGSRSKRLSLRALE